MKNTFELKRNFRKTFKEFLNKPNQKNKEALLACSKDMYDWSIDKNGTKEDGFTPPLLTLVKESIQGLAVSTEQAESLNTLLFMQAQPESGHADDSSYVALATAYDLIAPKRTCLKEVIKKLFLMTEKLDQEMKVLRDIKAKGSFFIGKNDIDRLSAKKDVIENLLYQSVKDIWNKSRRYEEKCVGGTTEKEIERMNKHIDTLTQTECETILFELQKRITPILNPNDPDYERRTRDTNAQQRSALQVHSFNDSFFFTFLSKLVQCIQEALGLKTDAEILLESSMEAINKFKRSPW